VNDFFEDEGFPQDEPIIVPIDGQLDLHTFSPKELPGLLDDYFNECLREGIFQVRVIHGKGKGILRDRVRSILKRHQLVENFRPATEDGGGWGATLVTLSKDKSR
jgi:DNA-nicking Smr family endonuclease